MYFIKNIGVNHHSDALVIENGIRIAINPSDNDVFTPNPWWGNISGTIEKKVLLPKDEDGFHLLSHVTGYTLAPYEDNHRFVFCFYTSARARQKIEGYLIFVENANSIVTNGEFLFSESPSKFIVKLSKGNFIEIDGKRLEVFGNKLWQEI